MYHITPKPWRNLICTTSQLESPGIKVLQFNFATWWDLDGRFNATRRREVPLL